MSRTGNPAFIAGDRIGSVIADAGRDLQKLRIENPEEYARVIAEGRATSEKYRRLARGGK